MMDAIDVTKAPRLVRRYEAPAAVGGQVRRLKADGATLPGCLRLAHPRIEAATRPEILAVNLLGNPTSMMRRDVWNAVGGYRSSFEGALDDHLWLCVRHRGALVSLPHVPRAYRQRPASVANQDPQRQRRAVFRAHVAAGLRSNGINHKAMRSIIDLAPIGALRLPVAPSVVETLVAFHVPIPLARREADPLFKQVPARNALSTRMRTSGVPILRRELARADLASGEVAARAGRFALKRHALARVLKLAPVVGISVFARPRVGA